MNPSRNSVVELPLTDAQGRSRPIQRYSVAVNAVELRHQMRVRGLTGAELARRANVSPATISHALNGRRIHPAKFRKIAIGLHKAEPMPGVEMLIQHDSATHDGGGGHTS